MIKIPLFLWSLARTLLWKDYNVTAGRGGTIPHATPGRFVPPIRELERWGYAVEPNTSPSDDYRTTMSGDRRVTMDGNPRVWL